MPQSQTIMLPPPELIRYTCGHEDADEYIKSGQEVATQLNLAAARYFGPIKSEFSNVLDFGCGTGRLLGALDFGSASVSGCDVGEPVSNFSTGAYPDFDIRHTGLYPPLPWESDHFDLIYSFSVFSHLTRDAEDVWLKELLRIGRHDAAYLITIQGDWMVEATLSGDEKAEAEAEGFLFRAVHGRFSDGLDFPEYYESSYHTSEYIHAHWSNFFEIVEVVKGDNPLRYLSGNQKFQSAGGDVPDFRPMGQDLVIARKR